MQLGLISLILFQRPALLQRKSLHSARARNTVNKNDCRIKTFLIAGNSLESNILQRKGDLGVNVQKILELDNQQRSIY